MSDSDPIALYSYFIEELNKKNILFIECKDNGYERISSIHSKLRPLFNGLLIANGGFVQESASKIIKDRMADMVSFGKLAIANNDLPLKFKKGMKLFSITNAPPR